MNRWTHPVQWMQSTMDRHEAYIKELHRTVSKLREEIDRLEHQKANRRGRLKIVNEGQE